VVPFLRGHVPNEPSASDDDMAGVGSSLITEPPPGMEPLAPPLPPPLSQPGPEFTERLAAAIEALRATGERLADQAQSDSLELAVLIARRILERELTTGTEPLFSLIRTAVRRLGESRKIVVHLCPPDAATVAQAGESSPLAGLAIARVEVMPDATLSPGDCLIEGEHGTVDGRLSTRLDEVRRLLTSALAEAGEGGGAG
jgi:flagellar biosynthesis/type III secretory pathway protein FliH